jgi:hypothetical protein
MGMTHGDKYRFLAVRRDRGRDRVYRLPLSIGAFNSCGGLWCASQRRTEFARYLFAKGIRDIASGMFIAMLIGFGSAHALGWFMLIASIIPLSDAAIVLHHGGRKTVALGVHGGTAVAILRLSADCC